MDRERMDIHAPNVRRALDGDIERIWGAFFWIASPQGHDYWHDRASGLTPIREEDRAFLESLLEDGE